jgi:primosomal protein N' (replication factor Y)
VECPECRADGIRFSGLGTQKLEAEVHARFPHYKCLRMDTDSMRRPGSHDDALSAFREGRAQILLGTQMIAKGLDFPNVTLVGIINADLALHLPDFRAAERTFQLVTQVAGRTGRGEKGGRVMMQTFSPDHPAIVAATRHDYAAFAAHELPCRENSSFPPFASLVRVVLRSDAETAAKLAADEYSRRLRNAVEQCSSPVRILGPAVAPIAKLRGAFRYHLLIQSAKCQELRGAVEQVSQDFKLPDGVMCTVDVDPVDML